MSWGRDHAEHMLAYQKRRLAMSAEEKAADDIRLSKVGYEPAPADSADSAVSDNPDGAAHD